MPHDATHAAAVAPRPLRTRDDEPAITGWSLTPGMLHLNHGSYGGTPVAAQRRQEDLRREMESDPLRWFTLLPARLAEAREGIARFLGTAPEATALVPNASGGASAVFGSVRLPAGSDVVVTDHGYGAVVMGAERLAARIGGRVVVAPIPLEASPERALDAVMAACTERTALLVVDRITSSTARLLPATEIADAARARRIIVLVDGAHVPGLATGDTPGDAWVGNLHKFACAPKGVAALVAPGDLGDVLFPLIDSWGARDPFPQRFDVQGTVDATAALAAGAAIAYIEDQWGWDRARRYMTELADYGEHVIATAFSERTGEDHCVDVGAPAGAMRLVRLPGRLAADGESAGRLRDELLLEHGVATAITTFRGVGYWRLSAHVYNTAADFEEAADRVVPFLLRRAAG
jgi:isopenicillin-N epimerase